MNKTRIVGIIIMLIGSLLAFKVKYTGLGVGLVAAAVFIHVVFTSMTSSLNGNKSFKEICKDFFKK